eukprot:12413713-Karenia_brevis.AAC.1
MHLEDSRTLSEYNIQGDNTLHVVLCLRGGAQFFIKTQRDKTITLDVEVRDILRMRGQNQDEKGISHDQQLLILTGKQFEDGRTITDYNIQRRT